MAKDIPTSKNHDRFLQLGIAIAAQRKMRGLSQEQLAEKAGILTLVLWELKALDDHDGKLSEVFKPILVMFPYVCLSGHFAYLLYKWVLPNINIVTTDKALTEIWIVYVTVAWICIIFSKTKRWLRWHKFR